MYIKSTAIFLTAAAILNSASTSIGFGATGDWPQWRGPNRDGVSTETGLLKEWSAKGPPLAWKANLGGVGFSSPSVVGDRLFITAAEDDREGLKEYAVCLNTADGKPVWKVPLPVGEGE